MKSYKPTLREPRLDVPRLRPPELVKAGAQVVLDETGNPVFDEEGNLIYGD